MPLSKAENRARMRGKRALKREGGTVLLPAATVRRLRRQGLNIMRVFVRAPVTLDDYRDLERRLEAKAARVEWQSGGIKMLRDQIATLEARLATLPAMEERELSEKIGQLGRDLLGAKQRILVLEADTLAQRAEAILDDALGLSQSGVGEEEPWPQVSELP